MKTICQNHKPNKRREILRWMINRARRLEFEVKRGTATPRQVARFEQLKSQI